MKLSDTIFEERFRHCLKQLNGLPKDIPVANLMAVEFRQLSATKNRMQVEFDSVQKIRFVNIQC